MYIDKYTHTHTHTHTPSYNIYIYIYICTSLWHVSPIYGEIFGVFSHQTSKASRRQRSRWSRRSRRRSGWGSKIRWIRWIRWSRWMTMGSWKKSFQSSWRHWEKDSWMKDEGWRLDVSWSVMGSSRKLESSQFAVLVSDFLFLPLGGKPPRNERRRRTTKKM